MNNNQYEYTFVRVQTQEEMDNVRTELKLGQLELCSPSLIKLQDDKWHAWNPESSLGNGRGLGVMDSGNTHTYKEWVSLAVSVNEYLNIDPLFQL